MALHPHVHQFHHEWLNKADNYSDENLAECFNKAFSLFTLYNKLYCEATFTLAREEIIQIDKNRGFPDRKGATEYAPRYIGFSELAEELDNCPDCVGAISSLIESLEAQHFYIKLSMPYGERQPDKDRNLLASLKSKGIKKRIRALLDLIYSVRCNMFHGNKMLDEVQINLLIPVTILQRKIIEVLYRKLASEM